jgi:iron complex outermembrane receptor protein
VPGFAPWFVYRQRAVSLGADLEYVLTENVVGELSGGMDWMSYTRTGDKPPMGDFIEPTARAGLAWSPAGPWRLRTSVGYKVRMPTMREVFGVALNRFLLNPDLLPERVISVEGGVEWRRANTAVALIPFAQFVSKTIDQRAVGPLRQRINLRGSRVYGLEVSARTQLADAWFLAGNVTASRVRRLRSSAAEPVYIAEKPAVLAAVSLDYENPGGIEANIEVSHTGRAYSLNAAGAFEALKISTQLNGRLAFNLERAIPWLPPTQIYIRADNLNDAWVEPQLGLPAPGRSVRGGLRVVW